MLFVLYVNFHLWFRTFLVNKIDGWELINYNELTTFVQNWSSTSPRAYYILSLITNSNVLERLVICISACIFCTFTNWVTIVNAVTGLIRLHVLLWLEHDKRSRFTLSMVSRIIVFVYVLFYFAKNYLLINNVKNT